MRNIKAFPVTNVLPAAPQICLCAREQGRPRSSAAAALGSGPGPGSCGIARLRDGMWALAAWGVGSTSLEFWEALPAPPRALVRRLVLTARINTSGCVIRAGDGP